MALTFYHGHGSPFSWRVWLALEHLGAPYDLKVISFNDQDQMKPEFIALNPRHQVPTITEDGFALYESTVILEYLDERYGPAKGERRLYPGDLKNRARVRRLVRETEEYLGKEGIDPVVSEYFFKNGAAPDAERIESGRKRIGEELKVLEGEMRGAFFAGDAPTAADFVLAPFLGYVHRVSLRKPESKLTELVPEGMGAWYKRVQALPFYDKTFPPHWR